ncbi:MAG: GNAT family N-acetyltransferase [Bacteroidales bacterium]|nr:GNAT family N-acetyltransferase [Bacteroidales bacterium]
MTKNLLKGVHVALRALEPEDEELLFRWENNPSVWRVSHTLTPISRHQIKEYLAHIHLDIFQTRQLRLVITHTDNDQQPIGLIDLFDYDPFHQRAGVGILIAENKNRHRGFASEALELLVNYAFTSLMLYQLYASMTVDNPVSLQLFEKTGFKLIGTRKGWIRTFDGWMDEWYLQLIRPDWAKSHS